MFFIQKKRADEKSTFSEADNNLPNVEQYEYYYSGNIKSNSGTINRHEWKRRANDYYNKNGWRMKVAWGYAYDPKY